MKKKLLLFFFISLSVLLFSCDKFPANNTETSKLKKIIGPRDTVYPLCSPSCPPTISRNEEEFIYDGLNRLTQRIIITRNFSVTPETVDTVSVFKYSYNDNSMVINSYSEKSNYWSEEIMHSLSYDLQNRILKDSITNPQTGNNKITRFTYLQDTVIQWEKQNFFTEEIKIDTMIISGGNIVKEKIRGFITRDLDYTVSSYINPLTYVNNFSLLATDRKNGSNSTLFMIYTPQYITFNMASRVDVTAPSSYITTFDIAVDSMGRVESFISSSNGKKITFEYY